MTIHKKSLAEQAQLIQQRQVSSVELCQHYLDRIERLDSRFNSLITVDAQRSLDSAREADERIANGDQQALLGLPLIHKDIFCTDGVLTSCGSKMLSNFVAPYDATVVQKLKEQGMVMLGKANMDEFAMGSSNENSYYGNVINPWREGSVPGGSSGGSAAAVAARLAPVATGTDTGGSIRQPAAFCGLSGIKPTYGRVSRYGMIAFASSLDQAGPLATSAEDCAMLLQAMSGFDERDSTSSTESVPDFTEGLNQPLTGLRVGVPSEYFADGLDEGVAKAVEAAIEEIKKAGAVIKTVSLPNQGLCIPAYYVVAPAEASSNLSRFDGVRFGHRCENPVDLEDLYKRSRSEGFGDEVKRRILIGAYTLSAGFYDAYYLKALQVRRLISNDFKQAFNEVDVILGPTTPTTAFAMGDKTDDPVAMYLNDLYTVSANLSGLPAMSIPCGIDNEMPVGLQLVCNHFQEAKLLQIAHQFQQITDWHTLMPTGLD
jgi:aspartyl-tRNA(Asn)/glutamyl-tRNA(Gln) amidotransferase subunit A